PGINNQILYIVVTPPGVTSVDGPNVLGEHLFFDSGSLNGTPYVWVGTCALSPSDQLDAVTPILAAELVNAVTDPDYDGYSLVADGDIFPFEVSDPAPFDLARVGGVLVTPYWSVQDDLAIIPTGQQQDFFVDSNDGLTILGDQTSSVDDLVA